MGSCSHAADRHTALSSERRTFPRRRAPLHIFEPRYRRMVRECLDARTPFGMLLAMDDGVTHVGCTAEILEVVKRYPDGRMDIVTVGRDPFRVVELFTEDPLLEGQVDYLEDAKPPSNPMQAQAGRGI